MAIAHERTPGPGGLLRSNVEATPVAKTRAVVYWAVVGAFFVGIQCYVFGAWILSDDFRHMDTGVTPVPDYMTIAARTQEALFTIGMVAMLYFVVWRPFRRNARLSLDGMVVLAFFWLWWQDPLFAYMTQGFNYSSVNLNMGGWAGHIPGWSSPHGQNIPQPLVWDLSFYIFLCAGAAIAGAAALRKWRARNPAVSTGTMFVAAFFAFALLDLVLEFTWVRLGLYHYAGSMDGWSIFDDRFYRFPLYEPIAVGVLCCAFTACRFFVNDRGETLAERGASELNIGERHRTAVRYLALVGTFSVAMFLCYSILINMWQVHAGAWPKAAQERSYLNNGVCGEGTSYACVGSHVAIPREGKSVHIGPRGERVVPPGTDTSKLEFVPLARNRE